MDEFMNENVDQELELNVIINITETLIKRKRI